MPKFPNIVSGTMAAIETIRRTKAVERVQQDYFERRLSAEALAKIANRWSDPRVSAAVAVHPDADDSYFTRLLRTPTPQVTAFLHTMVRSLVSGMHERLEQDPPAEDYLVKLIATGEFGFARVQRFLDLLEAAGNGSPRILQEAVAASYYVGVAQSVKFAEQKFKLDTSVRGLRGTWYIAVGICARRYGPNPHVNMKTAIRAVIDSEDYSAIGYLSRNNPDAATLVAQTFGRPRLGKKLNENLDVWLGENGHPELVGMPREWVFEILFPENSSMA